MVTINSFVAYKWEITLFTKILKVVEVSKELSFHLNSLLQEIVDNKTT